jgi:hypothetical protein
VKKARLLLAILLLVGCSRASSGGTGTGNPGLKIDSHAYNALMTSVTSLSFCVSEVRFVTDTGITISVPESQLGLIDLGDGSQTVTWGKLTGVVPGTVIDHVYIEIENELCPAAGYSVKANGMTITTELEFKFIFAQPYTVGAAGSVTLSLSTLVSKIDQAIQDGNFTNTGILTYINGSFEDPAIGIY